MSNINENTTSNTKTIIKTHNLLWKQLQKTMPQKRNRDDENMQYISGTAIKNYLLNDPMLDWMNMNYDSNMEFNSYLTNSNSTHNNLKQKFDNHITKEKEQLNVLFDCGNKFEAQIMDHLKIQFDGDIVVINQDGQSGTTYANFIMTKSAIMNGVPIIAQGVLFNKENGTRGTADLIVRSDYLNRLVNRNVIDDEIKNLKAPKLNGDYHYRIIDIKWTQMTLCANGLNIRNEHRFPCYKGQLAIYNCALGFVQGYYPPEAYIMAKSWKCCKDIEHGFFNSNEGYDCFDLMGVIDYNKFDNSYINKTIDAIKWLRELWEFGKDWNPFKPHRKEMYPNMSNKNDAPWTHIKHYIAEEINEITQVWYVNDKCRNNAHSNGVFSLNDKKCTSEILGITGIKAPIIDAIIDINRKNDTNAIQPDIIKNNMDEWQTSSPLDFYVDFETINKCFCGNMNIYNSHTESDIIFMIGVGYIEKNIWQYKVFIMDDLSQKSECNTINAFTKFMTKKIKQLDPMKQHIPRLFHWSQAEIINFKHANDRHDNKWIAWESKLIWVDMLSVFNTEPITIKGSYDFKLKSIGNALYKLKYINTIWNSDGPGDGLEAMNYAIQYYMEKKNNKNNKSMDAIIKYNEVDCKMIYEIVSFLRNNNCSLIMQYL